MGIDISDPVDSSSIVCQDISGESLLLNVDPTFGRFDVCASRLVVFSPLGDQQDNLQKALQSLLAA